MQIPLVVVSVVFSVSRLTWGSMILTRELSTESNTAGQSAQNKVNRIVRFIQAEFQIFKYHPAPEPC